MPRAHPSATGQEIVDSGLRISELQSMRPVKNTTATMRGAVSAEIPRTADSWIARCKSGLSCRIVLGRGPDRPWKVLLDDEAAPLSSEARSL